MPGRSPAGRRTLRSTLKPLCRQERIWATRSASMRLASSSRRKDVVFPDAQERFVGEVNGDGVESAVRGERAVGDQPVDVGMEVHELAERLDGEDAAGPKRRAGRP